jgi:hypothetical protein
MPDRPTGAGLTVPCASIFRSEDRDPVLVGANVTFTLHVPPIRTRRSDIHFPTPESSMYCGFDDALSTIVIPPRSCPGFEGVKVTSTLQTAPASRVPLHMSVARKGPVTLIQLNEIDLLPVFLRFTIFGLLVVLTGWAPKAKGEQGENSKTPVFSIEVIASGLLPRRTTSGLWSPLRSPTAAV